MSSNQHDINNNIDLNNYEAFFVLYMDNELTRDQLKMVENFLEFHPDLRSELDLLLKTRLPLEEIGYGLKENLLADAMRLNLSDENLLLYMDNELTPAQKVEFEKNLNRNKDLHSEYQLLLQTRLDAAEQIPYPYKKELYRRTAKSIPVTAWFSAAAIIILFAFFSIAYFIGSQSTKPMLPAAATQIKLPGNIIHKSYNLSNGQASATAEYKQKHQHAVGIGLESRAQKINAIQYNRRKDLVNFTNSRQAKKNTLSSTVSDNTNSIGAFSTNTSLGTRIISNEQTTYNQPALPILSTPVTSSLTARITIDATVKESDSNTDAMVKNDHKGSLKSFLRKATRMIEKRTGIDPSNNSDEILIGAVAVKLN